MNLFNKVVLVVGLTGATTFATANNVNTTAVNQSALTPSLITVKQALTLKDNTKVQLRGHVVKATGDEKYQFRDNTGLITVDIDDELWQGKPISANTTVTLIGEVDVDYKPLKRVEIDVDSVKF
ncbi:NirD/YgiW/YdeI family stress tolerance protein [Acinetobacter rongchengensis]|uniref:NirD/YgiW/YdeI family stress tolerance protein n=1 Tax=Acinetobacter rongchengensis TaxID=2419601 RepID=A0A3A8F6U8_9GAMM|nr:NirD/YgiW/YdeI family stress tolerance protein [Acinetobacter rongchengensis]RKG36463.1 NirD/YgiW/YdeI family stress tolerance protein [Acinetobacter rongchengensis]